MKFGFYLPNFDLFGNARLLADLAQEVEESGWDGFFLWDHLQFIEPAVDPWVALTAMALRTNRICLGTLVTPVPRRHIAKLAREVVSLDHLSGGRMILGVGAGYPYLPDYSAFGDEQDLKVRAAMLDEALELLAALWSGNAVQHHGEYYRADCPAFQPPLQRPRVPIWVAASWPSKRPLRRAAQWDGVVPVQMQGLEVEPDDLASIASAIRGVRGNLSGFDVIRFGTTCGPEDNALVAACAQAGASWWMEYVYAGSGTVETTRERIRNGPPRLAGD